MNNQSTDRLTEAIYALANELALHRQQAVQGPSQTGAAPSTSGDFVTVTNPRHEWHGMTGRVRATSPTHAHIDFPGMHAAWIHHRDLTKGENA